MLLLSLLSLTLLINRVCECATPCGPLNRCNCVTLQEGLAVDCQGANLSLQEICGICSHVNKIVLSLDVSNNNLTSISGDCFSSCMNLRNLSMRNTSLNSKEACGICRQFSDTLISLDLSENNISPLKDNCFTGCNRLEHLSLRTTNLRSLAAQSLVNLGRLRELNLDRNHLVRNCSFTNADVLLYLSNLQVLTIKENVDALFCYQNQSFLDNVPTTAFPSLKELHADGVTHVQFGENFTYFKKLTILNFSGVNSKCSKISLNNETFSNVPYLSHIDISKCNIIQIDAGTFEPLHELMYLNLSNNKGLGFVSLRNISYGLRATKTKVFDFSKVYKTFGVGTVLRRCDFWFFKDTSVEELYLNSNRLVMLETNALLLVPPNLTKIWAEDNNFVFGPYIYQFACVEKLQGLFLNNQNIVHDPRLYNDEIHIKDNVDTNEGNCIIPNRNYSNDCLIIADDEKVQFENINLPKNLSAITISGSNLKFKLEYKTGFSLKRELPFRLEYLDLSNNILYYLGRQFIKTNLKHLDLSNNFCLFIAKDFFDMAPNLKTVNLSHNNLGLILSHDIEGQIFKPLTAAMTLDLSHNNIAFLPVQVFAYLLSIENLNLSSNQLTEFKTSGYTFRNLTNFDLHNNQLTSFPVTLLEHLSLDDKNISIDLSHNFLEVSCENLEFLIWITENPHNFKNIDSYTFRKNGESEIISFNQLKEMLSNINKQCVSYTALISVSYLLILTFFIVILGGILYRYRWRLRYLYYMTKFRFQGYKDLPTTDTDVDYEYDAFLSCADEDMRFITNEVLPKLEDEFGYRCCIHARNFLAGVWIAENIIAAIRRSRKTVVILTQSFLASKWCQYEFHMARMEEIYSRKDQAVLFVLMYEDIDTDTLSLEMLDCINSETYAKYPADQNEVPYFWEGVKKALRPAEM